MSRYAFRAPYPPSVNAIWRHAGNGTYKTKVAKNFLTDFQAAFINEYGFPSPIEGALRVTMHFYRPRINDDADNRVKSLFDACNGLVWVDDQQVCEFHVYRHDAPKVKGVKTAGWVDVIIEEVEGE